MMGVDGIRDPIIPRAWLTPLQAEAADVLDLYQVGGEDDEAFIVGAIDFISKIYRGETK